MKIYTREQAQELADEHKKRVEDYTAEHLARRSRGIKHPIFDFLFEYYPITPSQLSRWHPGYGAAVHAPSEHEQWKYYKNSDGIVSIDLETFLLKRKTSLLFIADLLERTENNQAHFNCFGMHEWAMVYKIQPRHSLPLRLGAQGTNEVIDSITGPIHCTHYDAFRFFSPEAKKYNEVQLSRDEQPLYEQKGCLHATMDLYKWATKLGPLVPGSLWLDTFSLAWESRILDMQASPYDCSSLGFEAIAVETSDGKAEYVRRQRELAKRATPLRQKLVDLIRSACGS